MSLLRSNQSRTNLGQSIMKFTNIKRDSDFDCVKITDSEVIVDKFLCLHDLHGHPNSEKIF